MCESADVYCGDTIQRPYRQESGCFVVAFVGGGVFNGRGDGHDGFGARLGDAEDGAAIEAADALAAGGAGHFENLAAFQIGTANVNSHDCPCGNLFATTWRSMKQQR